MDPQISGPFFLMIDMKLQTLNQVPTHTALLIYSDAPPPLFKMRGPSLLPWITAGTPSACNQP